MSLEQKIEDLTLTVAKLIDVMSKGATVETKVTKAADADEVEDADETTTAEKPAKRKRRTKAEIAADEKAAKKAKKAAKDEDEEDDLGDDDDIGDDDADEGDDFGDDEADEGEGNDEVTADTIRDLLMRVKDQKGASAARSILADVGVKTIAQIPEKQYAKVIQLAKKAGVKL